MVYIPPHRRTTLRVTQNADAWDSLGAETATLYHRFQRSE